MFEVNTMNLIESIIKNELDFAKKQHGEKFNSEHEKYAVMLEEFEEADKALDCAKTTKEYIWRDIKKDTSPEYLYESMHNVIVHCIAELCQTAAMCLKEVKKMALYCDCKNCEYFESEYCDRESVYIDENGVCLDFLPEV